MGQVFWTVLQRSCSYSFAAIEGFSLPLQNKRHPIVTMRHRMTFLVEALNLFTDHRRVRLWTELLLRSQVNATVYLLAVFCPCSSAIFETENTFTTIGDPSTQLLPR
jgi:hypothetical protein